MSHSRSRAEAVLRHPRLCYGSATIPMRNDNFLGNLNTCKPDSYPTFSAASLDSAG